jgi:nucleoside-diphosphate-sugar epimerase
VARRIRKNVRSSVAETARALWLASRFFPPRNNVTMRERNRDMLPMFYTIDRFHLHPHPNLHSMPLSVIYIHDLIELIWNAALQGERILPQANNSSDRARGYYFACAGEHPSYAKWGHMLASALDRKPVIVLPLIPPIPWLVGGASELVSRWRQQSTTLNQDKIREASVRSWACSPVRAAAKLGFEPNRPLLNQLRATVDWYRKSRGHQETVV